MSRSTHILFRGAACGMEPTQQPIAAKGQMNSPTTYDYTTGREMPPTANK